MSPATPKFILYKSNEYLLPNGLPCFGAGAMFDEEKDRVAYANKYSWVSTKGYNTLAGVTKAFNSTKLNCPSASNKLPPVKKEICHVHVFSTLENTPEMTKYAKFGER